MTKPVHVLVTGATGKQGGAVARSLVARGHKVRALTRDASSPAAKALTTGGADLAVGSFDDRVSLDRALAGVDAVFIMSTPFGGASAEMRQGIAVADAARASGAFVLYTSVGSANRNTGIPHFDSKYEVEQYLAAIGVDHTILGPVRFMDNAVAFSREQLKQGIYAVPLSSRRKLAQIALSDIAACATAVLEDRARYSGKRFDIAGDDLTGEEAVTILTRVTGKAFSYSQVPLEAIRARMGDDGVKMYEWFDRVGYAVDLPALRAQFPTVSWHSFEDWTREQPWPEIFAPSPQPL